MIAVLAEKREQAKKLAAPYEWEEKGGYLTVSSCPTFPNGAIITWALGHLVSLEEPEAYDPKYKNWSFDTLPIVVPDSFKYSIIKSKSKQFSIVKRIINQPNISKVIIATDPGREGESIARLILRLAACKKPLRRLWTTSLTKDSVVKAFQNLLPEQAKLPLFFEAQARAQADWLVGLNTSRAYTIAIREKGGSGTYSCGRVQTPLLGLICKREESIENFVSQPFYEVHSTFSLNDKTYQGKWFKGSVERLEKEKAELLAAHCHGKEAVVRSIQTERQEYLPPLLHSLSSLQSLANKRYKYSPQMVLDICQTLYEKGYLSYPRTDSRYITEEEAKQLPGMMRQYAGMDEYRTYFPFPNNSIFTNRRYVNDSKVSDHHAIIPTEAIPDVSKLNQMEARIYDLIVRSVLAAHDTGAIFEYTKIVTLVDEKFSFQTFDKRLVDDGWRRIISPEDVGPGEEHAGTEGLPSLQENESGTVVDSKVHEGYTKAPKRYTEGDLIDVMKTAGKDLEDSDLETVMEQTEGLGTEATRSNIISVLKDREYIKVKNNLVYPTERGRYLIKVVGESVLSSAALTAKWEKRLAEIGTGQVKAASFMEQVKLLTRKLVGEVEKNKDHFPSLSGEPESKEQPFNSNEDVIGGRSVSGTVDQEKKSPDGGLGVCPLCGEPIRDKGKLYGCADYPTCTFAIGRTILGQTITEEDVQALLKGESTALKRGFKKDRSTPFDAYLILEEGKLTFRYPKIQELTLPLHLLHPTPKKEAVSEDLKKDFSLIEKEAEALKYPGKVVGVTVGPRVTRFELLPAKGVNYSSYKRFKNNFQAVLRAEKITMHIPIPGKNTIGIEVPNLMTFPVSLRGLLENKEFLAGRSGLTFPLGANIEGQPIYGDLSKMPHLLVAGTTGSGKSVFVNSVICSLLFTCTKEELRFVFIDPKQVELSAYESLPHLLMPIVKDPVRAGATLDKLIDIMMRRYDSFDVAGVKNISAYNEKQTAKGEATFPYIVLVIDELADLLMVAENRVEDQVQRLAQLARAAGIHMIIATQRPSKQCLSPVIKSNLPVRVAFSVASSADSMVILDQPGAEDLLGRGDMLYQSNDAPTTRIQSAFVSDEEIQKVVQFAGAID